MIPQSVSARRTPRRVWFIIGLVVFLLLMAGSAALGNRVALAYGSTTPKHSSSCTYNASHQLISGPSYCAQSNWSCVGTDVGGCVNGRQEVKYSGSCPEYVKYFTCGSATTAKQAASRLVGCTNSCHVGKWQPWEKINGRLIPYGNIKLAYAASCTTGCPTITKICTPNGTLTQKFLGCVSNGVGKFEWVNSCGSVESTHDGAASRCDTGSGQPTSGSGSGGSGTTPTQGSGSSGSAPSCTVTTTYSNPVWTGCTAKGEEIGYQHWSRTDSCSGTTSGNNTVGQHTSSTCQPTVRHQCAYAKPGYAQSETCLTSPQGGYADCQGWSNPYYDTYDCPIPTPIGN